MNIFISDFPQSEILKVCLNEQGIEENVICLNKTNEGKPYISNSPLKYNYSNKNNLWVGAFQQNYDVGVDVEEKNIDNVTILNSRFLNEKEKKLIKKERRLFSVIWTAKESYVKCLGTGITSEFNKFAVVNRNRIRKEISGLYFYHIQYKNYVITICSSQKVKSLNTYIWTDKRFVEIKANKKKMMYFDLYTFD